MLDIHPVCLRFFPCLPPTSHLFEVRKPDRIQKNGSRILRDPFCIVSILPYERPPKGLFFLANRRGIIHNEDINNRKEGQNMKLLFKQRFFSWFDSYEKAITPIFAYEKYSSYRTHPFPYFFMLKKIDISLRKNYHYIIMKKHKRRMQK